MSVPISLGMLSTFLFQVVDTYFVGKLGADSLAALGFASTIYFLMVGLFIGLAVGVSIIVGRESGAGNQSKVSKTALLGILLCIASSSFLVLGLTAGLNPLFSALGASENLIPLIRAYMFPLLLGMPLLTTGLMAGSILRATGNITKPEVIMGVAGVINLVFDYLLIFGKFGFPEMGIQGAAYATVLSWIFVILGMAILLMRDKILAGIKKPFEQSKAVLREIYSIGVPTIVTQIIGPLTLMYLTFILARQSELAVAAFGVASRIETLLMIGILGVSTAITPFIAQNLGANNKAKIDEAIAFGGRASTYLGLLVAVIMILLSQPIAGIFSDNTEVINYASNYFKIVSLSYVFYGLYVITTSIFNGLQLPTNSLKITLVKSLAFTIPLTLIGSIWGASYIFIGLSLSNVAAGIYAGYEMRKDLKKAESSLAGVNVLNEYKKDFLRLFGRK